jgi:hypothetical protein
MEDAPPTATPSAAPLKPKKELKTKRELKTKKELTLEK